jgi:hypothetical protein
VLALEFDAAHCYFSDKGNWRESRDAGKKEMNDGIKGLTAFLHVWRVLFNLHRTRTTRATLAQLAHAS